MCKTMNKKIDSWTGCYPSNWKGLITDESFAHPAKYSNKLIRRIYEHMFAEGWLKPGMTVVDPFGGVALGAFDACRLGLNWRGVELEPRFVKWGNENIELWNKKFSGMPRWSTDAVLLRGDSRFLAQVLSEAQGCVSSPPFSERHSYDDDRTVTAVEKLKNTPGSKIGGVRIHDNAGNSDGQLGQMKATNESFRVALSSPPYADGSQHTGGDDKHPERMEGGEYFGVGLNGVVSSPPYAETRNAPGGDNINNLRRNNYGNKNYGIEFAQLGAMKATDKGFDAAISSPPFQGNSGGTNVTAKSGALADERLLKRHAAGNSEAGYGESSGNLGSELGNDFWLSARTIIEQVYTVLAPGAHAVWVVKNYVKNKQIVPFCEQWQQMCEAVGFVTLHEHHAMLVRSNGKSIDLEGNVREHIVESKSFFRRIAEKKVAINNYWKSLLRESQESFRLLADGELWSLYNDLTPEEKVAMLDDGVTLKNPKPTAKKILEYAKFLAFRESGENESDWNTETRIDFEVVLCMEKPHEVA